MAGAPEVPEWAEPLIRAVVREALALHRPRRVAGLVRLDEFAAAMGFEKKTFQNDFAPGATRQQRQRWPEFKRTGAGWLTTVDAIEQWHQSGRSSWVGSQAVESALERLAG